MNISVSRYLLATGILISINCFGQINSDTTKYSTYEFHPNYKLQEGYGLILAFISGNDKKNEFIMRNIYSIGIAKIKIGKLGHGILTESALFELNRIEEKSIYGFTIGEEIKAALLGFGVQLNYTTDFSSNKTLAIRPRLIFTLAGLGGPNLDGVLAYDFRMVKSDFDNSNNLIGGLQYTIGVLSKK